MSEPIAAQTKPYPVDLEAGRQYAWCACGRSANQPYCDGTHKTFGLAPVVFRAEKSGQAFLCGCKRTGNRPYCDGTHKTL